MHIILALYNITKVQQQNNTHQRMLNNQAQVAEKEKVANVVKDDKNNEEDKENDGDKEKQKEKAPQQKYQEIPELMSIDEIRKPIISKQRKQDLKEKLELEKQSLVKVRQREKNNSLIVSFDLNPFREKQYQPLFPQQRNIIDQIQKINTHPIFSDFNAARQRFRQQMGKAIMLSQKIKGSVKEQEKYRFSKQEKLTERVQQKKRQISWFDQLPSSLWEIYKYDQENIYAKKQRGLNIFRQSKKAEKNDYVKQNFLQESHFIQKSIFESYNMTVPKIDCYKHISKFSRLLTANKDDRIKPGTKLGKMKQNPEDYLQDPDVTFDLNNLDFRILMNIASGRFTSQFFSKSLLQIEDAPAFQADDRIALSLSEKSEPEENFTKQDHFNKFVMTDQQDMDNFQKECMIKAPLLDEEKRVKKHYKRLIKQIQAQSKNKQALLMKRIFEKQQQQQSQSITMERVKDFRTPRLSYKDVKRVFEENREARDEKANKKGKTKEDQIWLQTFNDVLKMEIANFDKMQKIKKQSIFY